MTWSPLFNLSLSYKDAVYWNNLTALTDVTVSTVTPGSEGSYSFTPVTPLMIDTCPCTLSSGSTEEMSFKWTEAIKHTGNHEMEQHLGNVHLQLHCGTKQTKKLKQSKTPPSK